MHRRGAGAGNRKTNALRARMGEAALALAREHFTVERMVQGTSAVYERLVGALHHQ